MWRYLDKKHFVNIFERNTGHIFLQSRNVSSKYNLVLRKIQKGEKVIATQSNMNFVQGKMCEVNTFSTLAKKHLSKRFVENKLNKWESIQLDGINPQRIYNCRN